MVPAAALPAGVPAQLGLTEADLREAASGGVAVRVLDTPHRREVAAVAVVRLRATRAAFLEIAAAPARLHRANEHVLAWGPLGSPPSPAELPDLAGDPAALSTLEKCAVGRCGVKLDAATLERLQREVHWRSPEGGLGAARVLRASLAARAEAYWRRGPAALPPLADREQPVDVGARAREVMERSPGLFELAPDLAAYLRDFPAPTPPSADDRLIWIREAYWRREVVSLVHEVVFAPVDRPHLALVAGRQVYANHYFEGAIWATAFLEDAGGAWLVRFQRFETDHKRGGFNAVERLLVRHGARRRLEKLMKGLRSAIEGAPGPGATAPAPAPVEGR